MYQVIEINSAMLRSGKQLLSSFSEATQSHELTKWSAAATAGFFGSAAATSGGATMVQSSRYAATPHVSRNFSRVTPICAIMAASAATIDLPA